ncbi:MAG TPA: hypothetical protein EYP89_01495 [Candidatus Omnitrophica bacterium]|nr:hypothetical protein [Candidatus Omnitrophota bacterium]
MVRLGERIFLVVGEDFFQRQRAIESIKKKIPKSSSLNTITLYCREIDLKVLKENLFTFSFDKEKILIFKETQNLSSRVKDFLFKNIKKIITFNYVIFEIERDYQKLNKDKDFIKDKFFSFLFRKATPFKLSSFFLKASLEDFKLSIRRGDLNSSLFILEKLFKEVPKRKDILGMQILGILINEFGFLKNPYEKEKYFSYLWEADRKIKEKGIDSHLAITQALVKMFLR